MIWGPSGGVDSSVTATMLVGAVGPRQSDEVCLPLSDFSCWTALAACKIPSPRQRLLGTSSEDLLGAVGMPFRAQCLFCGHEVLAPDHALGGSACCPKCSSFFTLAPAPAAKATVFSTGAD